MSTVSLHFRFLGNFIAFADLYIFLHFPDLKISLVINQQFRMFCTVTINEINSYRVQASCPDSFFGEKMCVIFSDDI